MLCEYIFPDMEKWVQRLNTVASECDSQRILIETHKKQNPFININQCLDSNNVKFSKHNNIHKIPLNKFFEKATYCHQAHQQ